MRYSSLQTLYHILFLPIDHIGAPDFGRLPNTMYYIPYTIFPIFLYHIGAPDLRNPPSHYGGLCSSAAPGVASEAAWRSKALPPGVVGLDRGPQRPCKRKDLNIVYTIYGIEYIVLYSMWYLT